MYNKHNHVTAGPRGVRTFVVEVGSLGNYLNFNDIVTSDFIHEMVIDAFTQRDSDDDVVLFIPMVALREYLMDMVVAVTTDAIGELRNGHIDDWKMLNDSSLNYWREALDQLVGAVAKEAEKGKTVNTIVVSSNDNF